MMMRKILAAVLLMSLALSSFGVLAEGQLTTTQKSLLEIDGEDKGYFFARVENTGDAGLFVGSGKLVGFSANDDILVSTDYVSSYPGGIQLAPGEYAYVREFLWESVLKDKDIADYKFSAESSPYGTEAKKLSSDVNFEIGGVDSYNNFVYVTVTNDSPDIVYGLYVVAALFDANKELIYVESNSYDSLGLHPNSTVTLKLYVDNDLVKHYQAHDIKPTSADAQVYIVD